MSSAEKTGRMILTRRAALRARRGSAVLSMSEWARAQDEWGKLVVAAKKEGRGVRYSVLVGLGRIKAQEDSEAKHGMTVDILEARASEVRERIASSKWRAAFSPTCRKTDGRQLRCRLRRTMFRSFRSASEPWLSQVRV